MTNARRVAYVDGFSTPPVLQLDECLTLLRQRDWDRYVILSHTAATWVDVNHLAMVSGHPGRVSPRKPSEPDPLPDADAVLAAPLTFNSLCEWAAGISDTLALGILNESLRLPTPVTAAPCNPQIAGGHTRLWLPPITAGPCLVALYRPVSLSTTSQAWATTTTTDLLLVIELPDC